MPALHLATFRCDVTPPEGHPLCGGWIDPVRGVDDPLWAVGVVLLGMGKPVVLCAVDWTGLRNDAHLAWRKALAEATHTVPENVAVHCVHPHNAPFADTEAQKLLEAARGAPALARNFSEGGGAAAADAAKRGWEKPRGSPPPGVGRARGDGVPPTRRIVGADGKVKATRYSATKDKAVRDEPEGLI